MSATNPVLKNFARDLRKNMTLAERILWGKLCRKQIINLQFYRQRPIGKYIVDFYCPAKKLIIEVDGGDHFENGKYKEDDIIRENFLKETGYSLLRFTNSEIKTNITGVMYVIHDFLSKH